MLNKCRFFSIVIVLNNVPKSLNNLLENIASQGKKIGEYEIIIINNIPPKKQSPAFIEVLKKYRFINIINLEFKEIYKRILDICQGQIIVFYDVNYYPDQHWLEEIIKPFYDSNKINVVAGEIYHNKNNNFLKKLRNLPHKFINPNKFQWRNFYDHQIANLAIRKEFIKQQKYLNLMTINVKEINFYYRILREIEAEITYNPSAIIYDCKLDRV